MFATFESETDYFGSHAQQCMLNFRVRDLDAMLAQLRAKGADVAKETQDIKGVGRFGWVTALRAIESSCDSPPDRNGFFAAKPGHDLALDILPFGKVRHCDPRLHHGTQPLRCGSATG